MIKIYTERRVCGLYEIKWQGRRPQRGVFEGDWQREDGSEGAATRIITTRAPACLQRC